MEKFAGQRIASRGPWKPNQMVGIIDEAVAEDRIGLGDLEYRRAFPSDKLIEI